MTSILEREPVPARAGHASRACDLPVLRGAQADWPMPPARTILIAHLLDTAVPTCGC